MMRLVNRLVPVCFALSCLVACDTASQAPVNATMTRLVNDAPKSLLPEGIKASLSAAAHFDMTEQTQDVTNSVEWHSLHPAVATVEPDGNLTAHALGHTLITASFGQRRAQVSLNVASAALTDFTLHPEQAVLSLGRLQKNHRTRAGNRECVVFCCTWARRRPCSPETVLPLAKA